MSTVMSMVMSAVGDKSMSTVEIVSAVMLVLSCIFIITIVFFQGGNKGGLGQSFTGQSSDNYYQRNMGRSKEARLKRMTTVAATLFFIIAVGVNLATVHFPSLLGKEDKDDTSNSDSANADAEFDLNPEEGLSDDEDNPEDVNAEDGDEDVNAEDGNEDINAEDENAEDGNEDVNAEEDNADDEGGENDEEVGPEPPSESE